MTQRSRVTDTVALKKIMIEKGFERVTSLAEASGVSRNTLSQVLNGEYQPSSGVMNRLIETLQIEPEEAGRIFFSHYLRIA